MKIKAAFVFIVIVAGIVSFLGFEEIKSLKKEISNAKLSIASQKKTISILNRLVDNLAENYAYKDHVHEGYVGEDHSHLSYASKIHSHNYANPFHGHSGYADEDEFSSLRSKVRFLEDGIDSHNHYEISELEDDLEDLEDSMSHHKIWDH